MQAIPYEEKVRRYPEFQRLLSEKFDYNWDAYEVKTEDGWYLSLFRIRSKENEKEGLGPHEFPDDYEVKYPLLFVHGAYDSAYGFISRYNIFDKVWSLKMVDAGYDVWLYNARGNKHSDRNEQDGEWTLKEYWDFNWAD